MCFHRTSCGYEESAKDFKKLVHEAWLDLALELSSDEAKLKIVAPFLAHGPIELKGSIKRTFVSLSV